MATPLMPKATAVWLVENTALTFEQIGEFCGLHRLEVQGIADGDVAQGIKGLDPVSSGQLTREQIEKAQNDPKVRLKMLEPKTSVPVNKKKKGPRYTPLSRRQNRPDAIYWMLRHHPEISDPQISKLLGTTKQTIQSIRDRSHWNSANLTPTDPVSLGLCSQIELDEIVAKAAKKKAKADKLAAKELEKAGTIVPTSESLSDEPEPAVPEQMESAEILPEAPAPAPVEETRPEDVFKTQPEPEGAPPTEEEETDYNPDSVFAGLDKKLEEAQEK